MYEIYIHKQAQKVIQKAQTRIKLKTKKALEHLIQNGTNNFPFKIDILKGEFQKYQYFEIKIDKDFRIFCRLENKTFFIRAAGTHNQLHTG